MYIEDALIQLVYLCLMHYNNGLFSGVVFTACCFIRHSPQLDKTSALYAVLYSISVPLEIGSEDSGEIAPL